MRAIFRLQPGKIYQKSDKHGLPDALRCWAMAVQFFLYLEILLAFQNGHHLVVIPIRSYFTCLRSLSVSLAKRSPEKNNEILNSGLVSLGKAIIYV